MYLLVEEEKNMFHVPSRFLEDSWIGIVIYLHIEGALYAKKKCAQLVFSCFWLQNWCVLKFEKSCQFFDTLSFSL